MFIAHSLANLWHLDSFRQHVGSFQKGSTVKHYVI